MLYLDRIRLTDQPGTFAYGESTRGEGYDLYFFPKGKAENEYLGTVVDLHLAETLVKIFTEFHQKGIDLRKDLETIARKCRQDEEFKELLNNPEDPTNYFAKDHLRLEYDLFDRISFILDRRPSKYEYQKCVEYIINAYHNPFV